MTQQYTYSTVTSEQVRENINRLLALTLSRQQMPHKAHIDDLMVNIQIYAKTLKEESINDNCQ